jgi:hypothetical protein
MEAIGPEKKTILLRLFFTSETFFQKAIRQQSTHWGVTNQFDAMRKKEV